MTTALNPAGRGAYFSVQETTAVWHPLVTVAKACMTVDRARPEPLTSLHENSHMGTEQVVAQRTQGTAAGF